MNLRQFNRILRQVFLLPVIVLLLTAGALYWQIQGANATVHLIQEADSQITQATIVAKLILDEETGLRGYETTADTRFLQPYVEAELQLQAEFSQLEQLAGADPDRKRLIADMRSEHQTWRDAFALPVIATVRAGGKATDVELNLQGKSLLDGMRQDLQQFTRNAEQRRTARIERWHKQVYNVLTGLVFLALSIGVLIGLFTRSRLHAVSDAYKNSLDVLNRRAEEIYRSEQQLRTTLDSIGDGVVTCDADGVIQTMNPVAQELTGWSQEEAHGRILGEVFRIFHETTRAVVEDPVAKVKRLDRIVGLANHTVLVRKDGTELYIADSGAPIRNQSGTTTGIVLVFRDVTKERRTQEALLANEKLAVAGRLAATIAHEIHNPLDSVTNLLYLMRTGTTEDESKQFMEMAEQELARVTQISRAMLGLYRESKAPVRVDLREMLQEILLLMEGRLSELSVTVRTELPSAVAVDAFPAELRQVFTNLITNAAEAASPGGEVRISIVSRKAGVQADGHKIQAGATVTVADNGPGVPEEVRAQLFQPFFTTKGEHGTGLGLWVSRGIVNKHGGTIQLVSDTSNGAHGTTVSVFLATKPVINAGGD